VRLVIRIIAAAVTLTGLCAFGTTVGASTTAPAPSCGSTIHKANGQAWVCSFDDEFGGTTLNSSNWTPFTSVPGGFQGGAECYTPRNVAVSKGTLNLPVTRAAQPFTCAGKTASYNAGMVVSKQKFTQTYGRFEMRAKIPMSKGLHAAFWLLPENSYNAKGQLDYGEIDVMESGGVYTDIASPHLHYVLTPGNLQSGSYCHVANMATQFHTYTLEWTPTTMTFSYDGTTCWKTTWQTAYPYQPAGTYAPAPFDQPFYMILNMGTDTAQTIAANAVTSTTNLSQPMQVDYVRVWK